MITFFYTIANYILSMSDTFLTQPFGLNVGTLFPGPLAFRWTFQFYDQSQTSAELADLLERISPVSYTHLDVYKRQIKGYVMDDARLREPENFFGKDYFEEQLERIRDIRASERRFYQKITDIYSQCSADYDVESPITKEFFATVQNLSLIHI